MSSLMRYRQFIALGVMLSLTLGAAAGPATQPANFAAFRNGGGLSGEAEKLPPPPFQLRWTYQAGEEGDHVSIESAAAIMAGTVYVADDRGTLHAVDLTT